MKAMELYWPNKRKCVWLIIKEGDKLNNSNPNVFSRTDIHPLQFMSNIIFHYFLFQVENLWGQNCVNVRVFNLEVS